MGGEDGDTRCILFLLTACSVVSLCSGAGLELSWCGWLPSIQSSQAQTQHLYQHRNQPFIHLFEVERVPSFSFTGQIYFIHAFLQRATLSSRVAKLCTGSHAQHA